MKYDRTSRRAFLQGAGGALLALPLIPSLVRASADTTPIRYVHISHSNGSYFKDFFPTDENMSQVGDNVYARPLSTIGATVSKGSQLYREDGYLTNLGSRFDPFRDRVTVLRGLDVQVEPSVDLFHGDWVSTTASYNSSRFDWSIDMVLAKSKKFYATIPVLDGLRIGTGGERLSIYNGVDQPFISEPQKAFDQVFGPCTADPTSSADTIKRRRLLLVDRVYEDYKRQQEGGVISAEGKHQLDDWMSMVSDLEKRLNVVAKQSTILSCDDVPDAITSESADGVVTKLFDNAFVTDLYNRIVVAALLSGNTHSATLRLNGYKDASLEYNHSAVHAHQNKWRMTKDWHYNEAVASLLEQMDALKEANGKSLLDNSVVFDVPNMGDSNHRLNDLAVLVAGGGANGRLRMGQYIDYRRRIGGTVEAPVFQDAPRLGGYIGRPYNEFLISLLQAFGLEKEDYQRGDQVGFGAYTDPDSYSEYYGNRNVPLPYFFAG